jgi:hypothetical protein
VWFNSCIIGNSQSDIDQLETVVRQLAAQFHCPDPLNLP